MQTATNMLNRAEQLHDEIVSLRRHIHAHPELSFQEHETSKLCAERLSQLGYDVRKKVGKTGVTADKGQGVTVAIRADMDGLPIQEATGTSYQSKNDGVMHACGHDAHVSCALAAAK